MSAPPEHEVGLVEARVSFEEPTSGVTMHLVTKSAVVARSLVLAVSDPSVDGSSAVMPPSSWKFSDALQSDFVYFPTLDEAATWSVEPLLLTSATSDLLVRVRTWNNGPSADSAVSALWIRAVHASGSVSLQRVVLS